MPPKKSTPPPIDRPLSKAYLRQFTGWSTAYPPGLSEPNSLRLMENMMVDRNGALAVRPGLRYLTYTDAPDLDPVVPGAPGRAFEYPVVGSFETFYTAEGKRALLFAVREGSGKVGFRAVQLDGTTHVVRELGDPEIGLDAPYGWESIKFSSRTTRVTYLQIDNKILALSDAGEDARFFDVGAAKIAKRLVGLSVPMWEYFHKAQIFHPDAAWIGGAAPVYRRNILLNPSFALGSKYWTLSENCSASTYGGALRLSTKPLRTNMVPSPLGDVAATGSEGWSAGLGSPRISTNVDYLRIEGPNPAARTPARLEDLHIVQSAKTLTGVTEMQNYRISFDFDNGAENAVVGVMFYTCNGAPIRPILLLPINAQSGRFVTEQIKAPLGATTARVGFGFYATEGTITEYLDVKNVLMCKDGEPADFFDGGSGPDFRWIGTAQRSASVYHPPQTITITSDRCAIQNDNYVHGSLTVTALDTALSCKLSIQLFDRSGVAGPDAASNTWTQVINSTSIKSVRVSPELVKSLKTGARLVFTVDNVPYGKIIQIGRALLESTPDATVGAYFSGASPSSGTVINSWEDPNRPHECRSIQQTYADVRPQPTPETPTADTLVSSDATKNTNKVAVFYTFENEIGESAPSMISEIRIQRAWSAWLMQAPDANGKPGTATDNPALAADQLLVITAQTAYEQALAEGALRWNLYAMAWSDQDSVPPTAQLVASREMHPDPTGEQSLTWSEGGWMRLTPQRIATEVDMMLPTFENRTNYSEPPRQSNGLVAADRMVLVGDPDNFATIAWTGNQPGSYMNFTANRGGGLKTLSSGNLNRPASVQLWQNPQSVDTIIILCSSDTGMFSAYYMSPGSQQQGGSGSITFMGFEETTNTYGTLAPWAAEVLNTALYRPLDHALVKSTAANYNINHKTVTDKIANMWQLLMSKHQMVSEQLDNRLYYLVYNPRGEPLESGCSGNEIWVFDAAAEAGSWSRLAPVHASSIKRITIGPHTYLGVCKTDGIYYLDPLHTQDDVVDVQGYVRQQPIPWSIETNTQGANRAHDAWAHLQQVSVNLGNFTGSMEYGIRGWSANGKKIDISKVATDPNIPGDAGDTSDIEDMLLVKQDMKEWFFYARSLPDTVGTGSIGFVQYRYTPVSVNIGYEFGSVETFEYGSDSGYAQNGIPRPYLDYSRP